jgi:hypothetical protein
MSGRVSAYFSYFEKIKGSWLDDHVFSPFQNKVLTGIVNVLWYARNSDIHRDLGVRMVTAEIKRTANKHEDLLHQHTNVEAIQLLTNNRAVRRLKRLKPFELV